MADDARVDTPPEPPKARTGPRGSLHGVAAASIGGRPSGTDGLARRGRTARRVWLTLGAAVVAVVSVITWLAARGTATPPGYWETPLPPDMHVTASSAQIVGNLVHQLHEYYGSVGVSDGPYSIPIFVASRDQKSVPVRVSSAHGCNDFTPDTGSRIPIPPNAEPASGSDGSLVVSQPSTSTEWELWRARRNPDGSWTACWGGRLSGTAELVGVFPAPYGLSASGISYLDTVVKESDVASGRIRHVLAMGVVECNGMVAPADRTDCGHSPGRPSEGTWLRLPPALHMPHGLTPFARMVFRALQRYGVVVTDQSGAVSIGTEDPRDWAIQGHNGIDPITASFAGKPSYAALDGVPWSKLEVIRPPAPHP